jgi:xanthosine utilization system XapX-like protein
MKISSGLKTLFLVHFIVGLVFGLANLFIPAMYMGWLGIQVTDQFPWRIIGAAILAFTASSWYCYTAAEWDKVKIVVIAEIVWTSLVVLVGLYGLLFAGQQVGFWINVIIMAGFAAAFAYFYTKKQ